MEQRSLNVQGGIIGGHLFDQIVCLENLFFAWRSFSRGKRSKLEVQDFEWDIEDNLFQLCHELINRLYVHSDYSAFYVTDPKLRHIHKAHIRDRIIHHAVYNILYPLFDRKFIYDSYSCRIGKGTHRAVERLERFIAKAGQNNSKPVYVLKCDIKKFFDSIDHQILTDIINCTIHDDETRWLIRRILKSFSKLSGKGLPLGNLTSQLFGNIYMNEFDQFVKHILKEKYYIRYCDDFIILGDNPEELRQLVEPIQNFLQGKLKLELHPEKVIIRKYQQGIDFLGYVLLPHHRVVRTRTKRRMPRRINIENSASYFGILEHCKGYNLKKKLVEQLNYW